MTVQEEEFASVRALKILTIDGGGLQALSTLCILGRICHQIAKSKGQRHSPAPYELFDVICGIGTGGWLAMLLGRYRLQIVTAMSVYMDLAESIEPKAKRERVASKTKFHSRLDQQKLVAKIEDILRKKNLDPMLFDSEREERIKEKDVRCHYVFAAGAIEGPDAHNHDYQIFRTYNPKSLLNNSPKHVGPVPAECRMSWACAATGAAKTLLQPYTIGPTTYFDSRFPRPHNITELAIDEAYDLYGNNYPISVILNIGPGIPSKHDVRMLAKASRTFSWPDRSKLTIWRARAPRVDPNASRLQQHLQQESLAPTRSNTASSTGSEEERIIEDKIKNRLRDEQSDQGGSSIYCRIAPEVSGKNLSLNDVSAMDQSNNAMDTFFADEKTKELIEQAANRCLLILAATAA